MLEALALAVACAVVVRVPVGLNAFNVLVQINRRTIGISGRNWEKLRVRGRRGGKLQVGEIHLHNQRRKRGSAIQPTKYLGILNVAWRIRRVSRLSLNLEQKRFSSTFRQSIVVSVS